MSHLLASNYRGMSKYHEVYRELTYRARNRELMTYEEVGTLIGIPERQGRLMSEEAGAVCGDISEDEVDAGRPMLSALVVGNGGDSGRPISGDGFFILAKVLGRYPANLTEREFWERERDAVYAAWQQPPTPK
jgi:hypothetical protein